MKQKFSVEQIVSVLKQSEVGVPMAESVTMRSLQLSAARPSSGRLSHIKQYISNTCSQKL